MNLSTDILYSTKTKMCWSKINSYSLVYVNIRIEHPFTLITFLKLGTTHKHLKKINNTSSVITKTQNVRTNIYVKAQILLLNHVFL